MTRRPRKGMATASLRDQLRALAPAKVAQFLAGLSPTELESVACDWQGVWARESQVPPDDDRGWTTFLFLAGRGAGKTRSASEWVRKMAREHPGCRIGVVARTAADARDTCVEGEAGILAVHPPSEMPLYEPSKRRITWRNGTQASVFSADEPSLMRGPSHHYVWADELATWERLEETWANLQLGLRLGRHPRCFVSTTPRPLKLIRELLASPTTITRRGSTYDNAANLAPSALAEFRARYEGTRLGRQELHAELLWDTPGALWSASLLDSTRVREAPADLTRIVIGIDPATTANEGSDLTGVVACGRDPRGHLYVLRDVSLRASPDGWARAAVRLFDELQADRLIVEQNAGGLMCEATLRTVRRDLPITMVHASRGKVTRAEPVAALWEQGKAHIVASLPELEEELCAFAPGAMAHSPDRAEAMVWACTALLKGAGGIERLRALVGAAPVAAPPPANQEAAIRAARALAAYAGGDFTEPGGTPGVKATPPGWRGPGTWRIS